ncbi:hypothetical protein BH10ACT7_BH10ACT7_27750 [soil metagenome]
MTVVAVTGHRALDDTARTRGRIDEVLEGVDAPLIGVSALAAGADQIFAEAVLAAGGALEVIVPSIDYRESLDSATRATFDRLVDAATTVTTMQYDRAGRGAYLAAGLEMLDRCDLLVAVWDGEASRGDGGTADIVHRARVRGIPVHVIEVVRGA